MKWSMRRFALLSSAVCILFVVASATEFSPINLLSAGRSQLTLPDQAMTVLIDTDYPPFEFQSESGDLQGFDVDLIQAIGSASGLKIEIEETSIDIDEMITQLTQNKMDAGISAITITPERLEQIDFSDPYFKAGLGIAVPIGSDIFSPENLTGKRIAVERGTTGWEAAKAIDQAQLVPLRSAPQTIEYLLNNQVDAVINDAPSTMNLIKDPPYREQIQMVGQLLTEEFYGIAVPKNSPYLSLINTGLAKIIKNGTYSEIYYKWFGIQPPSLPDAIPLRS